VDHWLLERLARFPDRDAILDRHHAMTYQQLLERIEAWSKILARNGLPTGSVVGIHGQASPDICALFLAVLVTGRIVVPLPVGGEDRNRYLETAQAQALFDFGQPGEWVFVPLAATEPSPGWWCSPRDRAARARRRSSSSTRCSSGTASPPAATGVLCFSSSITWAAFTPCCMRWRTGGRRS
jgi:non-ribosomal peptide synthetase component F